MAAYVDFDHFEQLADEFDRAVASTPGIDTFCSSSDWILPARRAFHPNATPWCWRIDSGWAAFMRIQAESGHRLLLPWEAIWGLATPLASVDPDRTVAHLIAMLRQPRAVWDYAWVAGIPLDGPLASAFARHTPVFMTLRADPAARAIASLEGGVDGFLARRSGSFRNGLRRDLRACREAGIEWQHLRPQSAEDRDRALQRILDIEQRSWKGIEGIGAAEGPMREFVRGVVDRAARRGTLRVVFACRDGVDVGYCHGSQFHGHYRGFQVSFDDRHRALGLGNALQFHMIDALCREGVEWYDLGTSMPYKKRWSEREMLTQTLILRRT